MGRVRRWAGLTVAVSACVLWSLGGWGQVIEGTVRVVGGTETSTQESGLPGVAVSDGRRVTVTDAEGRFVLEGDSESRCVWISVPSGFRATGGWYRFVASDADYDFTVVEAEDRGPLVFALLADTHYAPNPEEFAEAFYDRKMQVHPDGVLADLVGELNALEPDFVIMAGDVVADAKRPTPQRVEEWMAAAAELLRAPLDVPFYAAVGNHDVVPDDEVGTRVFEQVFGPPYYSFQIKGVHCVVLNTNRLEGGELVYSVDEAQLEWLRADLALVPDYMPVLVFAHQPSWSWADTAESTALLALLADVGITAMLTGHWHVNFTLREVPFVELTSGAVAGAWWEGPGPDGSSFGYRVFHVRRGQIDSVWRDIGAQGQVQFPAPESAVLAWSDRLVAQTWGRAVEAVHWWDDGPEVPLDVHSNELWSTAAGVLNVSTLATGFRALNVRFVMEGGTVSEGTRWFYVESPSLSLAEVFANQETFQGRLVAALDLEVRAVLGANVSATDGTATMLVGPVPFALSRGDRIGLLGQYRPTSARPVKPLREYFLVLYEGED